MEIQNRTSKKDLFFLWSLCILGSWCILPYIQQLAILPNTVSMWKAILLASIQAIPFFGIICWISFKILQKTDLHPFSTKNFLKKIACPAIICGVSVGLTIFFFDKIVFNSSLLSAAHPPPFWIGALGSIYGGVNEEVLLRLFLFTSIYFLVGKCLKIHRNNRLVVLWSVNILVSLVFGIGHLAIAFKLIPLSAFEIFRILFLNGIAGIAFGWLYWSRGIWAAILAHFVTDLLIHAFLI